MVAMLDNDLICFWIRLWSVACLQVWLKKSWRSSYSLCLRWIISSFSPVTPGLWLKEMTSLLAKTLLKWKLIKCFVSSQSLPSSLCKSISKFQEPGGHCSFQRPFWWLCVHWQSRFVNKFLTVRYYTLHFLILLCFMCLWDLLCQINFCPTWYYV